MKKLFQTALIILLPGHLVSSQTIPASCQYLSFMPPGNTPERFQLAVTSGSFTAERIAISNDGKEIYYTEVNSYYPASGDTIRYYRLSGRKWKGPYNLFPGYLSPALSLTGDTMYFQTAGSEYETFMSVKKGKAWSRPQRILKNLNSAHYLQISDKGSYYISSKAENNVGGNDWCKLIYTESDSVAVSLREPLNNELDNLDFFVAGDESYIIVAINSGLAISYPTTDGGWTLPVDLGPVINFGLASWGPYVTADNKYLFYTTGTKPDYSDTGIFWVRIDYLIDIMKNTRK